MTSPEPRTRRWILRALAGAGVAPAPALAQTPPQTAAISPGEAGARLESAFDQAMRVTVPVRINGRGPFAFVVDTGANSSVLSQDVADACGLIPAGAAPVHGILASTPAALMQVDRFEVGGLRSARLRLPALPRGALGADGLLGLDVLRDRRMLLDFRARTFDIAPSRDGLPVKPADSASRIRSPRAPVTVAARFRSGQLIIIDAAVGRRRITAFLDSGSQVTVANMALRQLVLTAQPRLGAAMFRSRLISATGQASDAEFGPLPGLRIGGVGLSPSLVAFADLHIFNLWDLQATPSLLIGVDVLRLFDKVAFDFGQRQITFWPSTHPAVAL